MDMQEQDLTHDTSGISKHELIAFMQRILAEYADLDAADGFDTVAFRVELTPEDALLLEAFDELSAYEKIEVMSAAYGDDVVA